MPAFEEKLRRGALDLEAAPPAVSLLQRRARHRKVGVTVAVTVTAVLAAVGVGTLLSSQVADQSGVARTSPAGQGDAAADSSGRSGRHELFFPAGVAAAKVSFDHATNQLVACDTSKDGHGVRVHYLHQGTEDRFTEFRGVNACTTRTLSGGEGQEVRVRLCLTEDSKDFNCVPEWLVYIA